LWLESLLGPLYPKRWEFFAITALFFVVLAFPGFIFRYLVRQFPSSASPVSVNASDSADYK
jgi:hypothetical protein